MSNRTNRKSSAASAVSVVRPDAVNEFVGKTSYLVASQFAYFRRARNLTQKQLAELCGMKEQAIQRLEKTPDCQWSVKTASRLASALDLKINFEFKANK